MINPQDSATTATGMRSDRWQFWIDRGGTFTDIVARSPEGVISCRKLLSENPGRYDDAILQGIRDFLGQGPNEAIDDSRIAELRIGTTVATNALLERKGEPTLLVVTRGFADALLIAYQNRPFLFARRIIRPTPLYQEVVEADERVLADGTLRRPLDRTAIRDALVAAWGRGLRAIAIVLMHGYRYPAHEAAIAEIARDLGFTQISVSHEVSPLMRFVSRGDTTVVDAYLSPILRRYTDRVAAGLGRARLLFMQSNGGLTTAERFHGRDAILSGPAGGIVGMAKSAAQAGYDRAIGFDMGGTSTDVSHYAGRLERIFDTEVAGVRLRAPMMDIHTVAAGGGSICRFDGTRLRVGPESAGAFPGPACYGRGGPLTITDCNVMLGRIQPDFFPAVFGADGQQRADAEIVHDKFKELARDINRETDIEQTPATLAEGFLRIAVEHMATAIKKISIQRGHDPADHVLVCFGGAAGQHACPVADRLGMSRVLIHPLAGVLSAYGIGMTDLVVLKSEAVERPLTAATLADIRGRGTTLSQVASDDLTAQIEGLSIHRQIRLQIKYLGTDSTLEIDYQENPAPIAQAFETSYRQRYGFAMTGRDLIVESFTVEVIGATEGFDSDRGSGQAIARRSPVLSGTAQMWQAAAMAAVPVYDRRRLVPGDHFIGPAFIREDTATTIVDADWSARIDAHLNLILERTTPVATAVAASAAADPVMLELFASLFMAIADQMGIALRNTAYSVNIKERLDFSCAIFDAAASLVANAPHVPVHLGSMGDSVATIIAGRGDKGFKPGDAYVLNAPYHGGTHLPDITVVMPVFVEGAARPVFYVAARGHHSDIGGLTPGSMPSASTSVLEEGVLIDDFQLVAGGIFRETEIRALLGSGPYPARNPDQNIADLRAQIAACTTGASELVKAVERYGLDVVRAYMNHIQDSGAEAVRRAIGRLRNGAFNYEMDDGAVIRVAVTVDHETRSAIIDFTGTSAQRGNNFNAPLAVTKAAVLYVFRTLVDDDILLNGGCFRPLDLRVPEGSMLNPRFPAAVVAGNVETSQAVTDALYGALGVMAAAQGTMNNLTFGDDRRQYYETIAGGAGAGPDFDGASAVQTHMTNSRLTDPEILEWRYPVLVESFAIKQGSGGAGAHRGGDGVIRRIRFLEPMIAAILSNRRRIPPFGLEGGDSGAVGRNSVERSGGTFEDLPATVTIDVAAEDVLSIETPGGGGYGIPRSDVTTKD